MITDPMVILRALQKPTPVRSLSALPRVEYYSTQQVRKGSVDVLVERPASIHFEALSPTGNMLQILTSDGVTIALFGRGQKICYRGKACPGNISRLLPIYMRGADVVGLLMGNVPLIRHTSRQLRFDRESGNYELTLSDPARHWQQRILVRPTDLLPVVSEVLLRGKRHYILELKKQRLFGSVTIPMRINFKMPHHRTDMAIKLRDVKLNVKTTLRAFRFQCPDGVAQRQLRCE